MSALVSLLRLLAWRRLRQEPFRLLLTLVGVGLGVAVFIAIKLANTASVQAFQNSLEVISGKTQLEVSGGDPGVAEDLILTLAAMPEVKRASPVIRGHVWVRKAGVSDARWRRGASSEGRSALVLGLDLLGDSDFRTYSFERDYVRDEVLERIADPEGVFLTRTMARAMGVKAGDFVEIEAGRRMRFRVRGVMKPEGVAKSMDGRLLMMDVAVAQEALDRLGKLDRIDLILKNAGEVEAAREKIRAVLPPGVVVSRPERRGRDVEKMLASFQLNLTVLSVIALLAGCFLIYNTMSASVLRRRGEIATLRGLGVTARGVALLYGAEALCIGLAGACLGLAAGAFMARGALSVVSQTISNLFAFLEVGRVAPTGVDLLEGLGVGVGVAFVSGVFPAVVAARQSPRRGLAERGGKVQVRPRTVALLLGGALLAGAVAWWLGGQALARGTPAPGYLAAGAVITATALASLPLLLSGSFALREARGLSVNGRLAAHGLGRHPQRNAVTLASLAIAVSMLVSLLLMIESFRSTVEVWTHQTLRADFYAAPASGFIKGARTSVSENLLRSVRSVPGVAAVDGFRAMRLPWRGERISLAGGDFRIVAERGRLLFLEGDARAILTRARTRGEAVITETFANAHGIRRGDVLTLPAPAGEVRVRVAGVYYDYTTDGGYVVVDRAFLKKHWGDARLNSLAVYIEEGARPQAVRAGLESVLDPAVAIVSNARLKRRVLRIFDQTFAITYALEFIAVLVALLGVATGLGSNVVERAHEIGALRAMGATRARVGAIVMGEAAMLGALSVLLGLAAGVCLASILIFVVNKLSFGWTIQYVFPWREVGAYLLLVVFAALAAGWLPARAAARVSIGEAVGRE